MIVRMGTPLAQLAKDLADNTAPQFSWITPNICNDMHGMSGPACPYPSTGAGPSAQQYQLGDTFLHHWIDTITESRAWTKGSVIFVTWDEGGYSNVSPFSPVSTAGCCDSPIFPNPALNPVDVSGGDLTTGQVFGGGLVRNEARALFTGEGAECTLNGLYQAGGRQHVDNHTVIDHAVPRCASHELYKGVLDGKAHGVFNGKILVREDAQKTDAKQTNKTLLLSEDAVVNTKPQLEIYADDVKCTHGATIGQLNDESIFYLRARGIGLQTARRMLIHAFAAEIIDRIRHTALREEMDAIVWDRLEQNPMIADQK